LVLTCTGIE